MAGAPALLKARADGKLLLLPDGPALPQMRQIVHNDDVTGREFGHEYLDHISGEGVPVDGAIEYNGRHHAGIAQACDKRRRFPMAMRHTGPKPLASPAVTMPARHVGAGPSLVDEHQSVGIEVELPLESGPAAAQDVGPLLLGSVRGFFTRGVVAIKEPPQR